ncbi:MAG: M48 family metallopeptidase [Chitinophagaceae bacterium]
MKYVGLTKQIQRNNLNSFLLLIAFPVLLLGIFYIFFFFTGGEKDVDQTNILFIQTAPVILIIVGTWFLIAWAGHSSFIRFATGSKPLERTENKRVYNLLENICISQGMQMPKLYIIDDDSLNAFASGINNNSYSISLSKGIIEKLDDDELEGVIAHELTHIKNRDVRLLIVSIIFVGIFAFLAEMAFRSLRFAGRKSGGGSSKDSKGTFAAILIVIAITAVAYLISLALRFGISRKREYLADAGAAEITKKPYALASALRKISDDPMIEAVRNRDVAQLFISNPKIPGNKSVSVKSMFATHPPIEKRISLLEQFV